MFIKPHGVYQSSLMRGFVLSFDARRMFVAICRTETCNRMSRVDLVDCFSEKLFSDRFTIRGALAMTFDLTSARLNR